MKVGKTDIIGDSIDHIPIPAILSFALQAENAIPF